MKQLMCGLVAGLCIVGTAWAEPDQDQQAENVPEVARKIALVNAADLDKETFDRVVKHVEKYVPQDLKILPAREPEGADSLEGEAKALNDVRPSEAYCLVALVKMNPDVKQHGSVHPTSQIAVINATALRPAEYDAEIYGRRLEKETIRCIGLLAGLPPCVNPRCALWHYSDDRGLDKKGRNMCPPCYIRYEKLAKAGQEAEPASPEKADDTAGGAGE